MTVLFVSPDFASHYLPIAVTARAARDHGHRVVVATGPTMRSRVEADRFEWRELRLGSGSNTGIVERSPSIDRFLVATQRGPIATLRLQARDRAEDLLWQPTEVALRIADLCDRIDPDHVVVDHVSFGSTLAMQALRRPFVSVVPGHPSQLPVGDERYGVPPRWPHALRPDALDLADLERQVDEVAHRFTARWNRVLAEIAPGAAPVDDAFRVHGDRVLYNSPIELQHPNRLGGIEAGHRFVGPLVRDEAPATGDLSWRDRRREPRVYVAFGTFLSHRTDVLARVAGALRSIGARVAIAIGPTDPAVLGPIPDGWIVAPTLPQVALLEDADLAIHHGGNNSVQESLAAGVRQIVMPFSTDQFANASDLERTGLGSVAAPNTASIGHLAGLVEHELARTRPAPITRADSDTLWSALTDPAPVPVSPR